MILKNIHRDVRAISCIIILSLCNSIILAQNQDENLLQGTWKLTQVISSKQKKEMTLHIKYSTAYNRYFGNIDVFGNVTTLDSIDYNERTKMLSFSSHIRNKDVFNLKIVDDTIKGTVISEKNNYDIIGQKTSNSNSKAIVEYGTYKPTKITNTVKDLYIETGNKTSKTVLLVVQGGPYEKMQYTNEFDKWKDKLHIIFVKQAQTINPTLLPPENNLKLEDAYTENLVSVEILRKVIEHFKNNDKKVLVWGVSYGAWIIQKYIAEYGIGADAVSISAGRLDIEPEIWKESKLNQTVYDVSYKHNNLAGRNFH